MKKTKTETIVLSSTPTSQSKTPEMDLILKAVEEKLQKEKEEKELQQLLETQMDGLKNAMSNTIDEIMKG